MAELKKNLLRECPFCGSKAELICFNFEYGTVTVGCTNEDCDITMGKGFFTDEEAIEHWNKRATEAEIRAKAFSDIIEKIRENLELPHLALDYIRIFAEQLKEE